VKLVTNREGGSVFVLNFGRRKTKTHFVICIAANTQWKADAVTQLMKNFSTALEKGGGGGVIRIARKKEEKVR